MSVSPPHWPPNNASWGQSGGFVGANGSFVGSIGALGSSFGQDRDRELEARYVKDFACCGRQLNGLARVIGAVRTLLLSQVAVLVIDVTAFEAMRRNTPISAQTHEWPQ